MILLQNHFNGGCVTVVEDSVNDKTEASQDQEKIRIDDILNNQTYDEEQNLDKLDLLNADIDINCNFYDDKTTCKITRYKPNNEVSYIN